MYSALDLCLAVLFSLWIGACVGVIAAGILRSAKQPEQPGAFLVPAAHHQFEHESDAPYPRFFE